MIPDWPPHMLQQEGIHSPASRPQVSAPTGLSRIVWFCTEGPEDPFVARPTPAPVATPAAAAPWTKRRRPIFWSSRYMAQLLFVLGKQHLANAEEQQSESHDAGGEQPFRETGDVCGGNAGRGNRLHHAPNLLSRQRRDHDIEPYADEPEDDQQSGQRHEAWVGACRPGEQD